MSTTIIKSGDSDYQAIVDSNGALRVVGSMPSGTINTDLNGLPNFQTSQVAVGLTPVQLTITPLAARSALSLKAITTGSNIIYVGNSNTVSTSTGYPLFNGDSLSMDLTGTNVIYAVASAAAQTLCILEIG